MNQLHNRIVKDFLDLVILMELKKRPMSGHDVIFFVHNKFHTQVSSGTVYSRLYFLERDGLIRGELAQRRRVYMLTEMGKENVETLLNVKDKILGLLLNLFVGE